ncbi:L-xylulose reductase [Aspergillus pseudonomiae]|uniref:L-xylulose reductase n=1 Tax=Aspergillus pseudonomiae TaxID=1506151 RepID=A0A5N6HR19_9EURO|nr:L-xylulose reductase [Aspergillus pseudonomiae]KAB8255193.1 L-xylulose reductase [Aspergillus pseudonomiae]KAE8399643.1 L-xylulose reductase [Aspergillus pseudonomiae]
MAAAQKSIRWPNPTLPDSVFKMFDMHGKVVIITGGSGGIGYQVGRALAEAGADVALWYNNSSEAEDRAATIAQDFGVKCKAYKCSVQNFNEVEAATQAVVTDFGRLDVMIANAGIPSKAGGLDDRLEDWHRVVDIDFSGAYYCARVAGEIFRKQGSGNMIFTASMSGHAANVPQQQACYNACKAGVIHLAKSLAVEWAGFARVNSVSPGYIDTPISGDCPFEMKEEWYSLTPLKRDADPRELKGVYLYLASDASTYTTGSDIVVDGGYTCR